MEQQGVVSATFGREETVLYVFGVTAISSAVLAINVIFYTSVMLPSSL